MDRLWSHVGANIAIALVLVSCVSDPGTSATAPIRFELLGIATRDGQPDLRDVTITLNRTPCMGWCPVYEVTPFGRGGGVYEGRQFVTTTGRVEFESSAAELASILDQFEAIDFLRTEHRCRWLANDAPAIDLRLRVGTREQRMYVMDLPPPDEMGPEERALHVRVDEIAKQIDTRAKIESWIGSEVERKALYDQSRDRTKR